MLTGWLDQATAAVSGLADQDPHLLADTELLLSTEALLTLHDRIDGIISAQLQVMDVRDVTVAECGRQTRSWLIEEQHLSEEDATRRMSVAKILPVHPGIGEALRAGRINHEHARVIAICLRKVSPDIREVVEKELLKAAESCDPSELRRFCREVRSRLGTDESAEAAEQRKYDDRWVTLTRTLDDMHRIDGMLDPASAAVLQAALAPLMGKAGEVDDRTVGQRRADALVALAEFALTAGQLPHHGGEKPQVVTVIPFADLSAKLQNRLASALMNGLEVSPSTARMMACDAGIIPAVLGSHGEVLDLGRKQPAWSVAQRRALRVEDRGCRFPSCKTGLDHCQIHHQQHWAHGGHTDTSNGIHLCRFHHWLVHHSNWQIEKNHRNQIRAWRT